MSQPGPPVTRWIGSGPASRSRAAWGRLHVDTLLLQPISDCPSDLFGSRNAVSRPHFTKATEEFLVDPERRQFLGHRSYSNV